MRTELAVYQHVRTQVQSLSTLLRFDQFAKQTVRKLTISIVDIITTALLKHTLHIATKKGIYDLLEMNTRCTYKTLVVNMNRFAVLAARCIGFILAFNRSHAHPIKHTDSTSIPVCLNKNARYHRTMKDLASSGAMTERDSITGSNCI